MRDRISLPLLFVTVLPLSIALSFPLTGCDKDEEDLVDRGLELKTLYAAAFCAAASDAACATDDSVCVFQPYDSVSACESAVNIDFSSCPNLWEPLAEAEDDVQACVQALESMTCGATGLCDEFGSSVFPLPECEVVADLQGLWCEGADTF